MMFKYPDNIIVNWLRSKMQGKIDSLQSQVDELEEKEKNLFNFNDIAYISSGDTTAYSIEKINDNSFSGTTSLGSLFLIFKIGNIADFIGKHIAFFCNYNSVNTVSLTNAGLVYCKTDGSDRHAITSGVLHNTVRNIDTLSCGNVIDPTIPTEDYILGIRLYISGSTVPNTVTFSNILIKNID